MERIWCRFFLAAALLLSATISASADDSAVIDRWYSALLVADRTELSELLSE
ncbi:nuclear transport factor 2 family protein, partial [Mesorhizobium sp. M1A.F.Ca.IN.020.06.1.1]